MYDSRGLLIDQRESTKSKVDISNKAGWTPALGWLLCSFLLPSGTEHLLNKHFHSGRSIRATIAQHRRESSKA